MANRMKALTGPQAKNVYTYLKGKGNSRDVLLWSLGITTGLRVSDLLSLTWSDFTGADGEIVETVTVKETKTEQTRTIDVLTIAREALVARQNEIRPEAADYLFAGRTGAPITREQARRLVKQWCADCNLSGDFGTHTMRKAFATVAYQHSGGDPVATARVTGHRNPMQLMAYIGVTTRTEKQITRGIDKAFS
jgi:integrase